MKAIRFYRYGGPAEMVVDTVEAASPVRGEVLVEIAAAAINPVDWKIRNGELKIMTGRKFPRGMGSDFAGTVIAVGPGVTRVNIGDPVFGQAPMKQAGAFAEQIVISEQFVARKPDNLSFESAACLPIVSITAWLALVETGRLAAGQKLLIAGCQGGVGHAAVQIARSIGAEVEGTCSAATVEQACAAGVAAAFDYRTFDLREHPRKYDLIFDTAGALQLGASLTSLNRRGKVIDINPTPGRIVRALVSPRVSIVIEKPSAQGLDAVAALARDGVLSQPVAERANLHDAIPLLAAIEQRAASTGKGVILFN